MSDLTEEFDIEAVRARVEADPGCAEFPALAELERLAGRAESAREISEIGLERAPARLAGRVSLGLALIDLGDHASAVEALRPILDPLLEPHRLGAWDEASRAESTSAEPDAETREDAAPDARSALDEQLQSSRTPVDRVGADAPIDEAPWSPPEPQPAASFMRPYGAAGSAAGATLDGELEQSEIDMAFEQAESQPDEMISANRMAEEALLRSDLLCGEEAIPEVASDGADFAPDEAGSDDFDVDHAPAFRTETMAGLLERQGDPSGAHAIREELRSADGRPAPFDAAAAPEPELDTAALEAGSAGRATRILTTLEGWLRNIQRGTA